jgi:hypothetical protein
MDTNKPSVTITGKLIFDDVKAFSRISFYLAIKITRILAILLIVVGALIGLIFLFDIMLGRPVTEDLNIALLYGAAILLFLLIRLILWATPRMITWGYKILFEEFKTTISGEAFIQESESSTTKLAWPKLYKIIYGRDHILFYISATMAFILPKRFIPEGQLPDVETIISTNMPSEKVITRII